jgi:hypothetical protein
LLSYHFEEERYRRHEPKNTMRERFNKIGLPWEYTIDLWEEEEVHQNAKTYDDVIFNRRGKLRGRITDEEKGREEAKKKLEEEEDEKYPHTSSLIYSFSTEEVEEGPTEKKGGTKRESQKRNMM